MPLRIFKRKSNRKCVGNFDSTANETRIEVADEDCHIKSCTTVDPSHGSENMSKGTRILNRIFIGNIAAMATEWDLRSRFETYGIVKDVKIVRDHTGISKGYGFVTFATEAEANGALEHADIIFKGRKLNIAPAIRKQNYHSHLTSQDGIQQNEKYPRAHMVEYSRMEKFNDNNYPNSDYLPSVEYEAVNSYENSTVYADSGTSSTALDCESQENSQVNILPYPTIVYVLDQNYQYSSLGIPYRSQGFQEVVPLLPAPQMLYQQQLM